MTSSAMPANTTDLEKRLWNAADELRANSKLKSSEYSVPVLGLIFLRYADWKFSKVEQELKDKSTGRRGISKADYQAKCIYLSPEVRFSKLLDKVDKERMKGDSRMLEFGMPKADNANYLWIHFFYSALNETGRAGFVMANSASDARGSELEIRKQLIQAGVVDVMVAVSPNFFYTVTLPCTLWFLDRGKVDTTRKNKVLFIDARQTYRQVDRAHREFIPEQIEFLANIVRLYRREAVENIYGSQGMLQEKFPDGEYVDVPGLCKASNIAEIEAQGWSLNPGRYVGVVARAVEDFSFLEQLEELNEELETLNVEASELEQQIAKNVAKLLEVSL